MTLDAGNMIFFVLDIDGLGIPSGSLGFRATKKEAHGLERTAWSKTVVEDNSSLTCKHGINQRNCPSRKVQ
jgi:hypothetical protein